MPTRKPWNSVEYCRRNAFSDSRIRPTKASVWSGCRVLCSRRVGLQNKLCSSRRNGYGSLLRRYTSPRTRRLDRFRSSHSADTLLVKTTDTLGPVPGITLPKCAFNLESFFLGIGFPFVKRQNGQHVAKTNIGKCADGFRGNAAYIHIRQWRPTLLGTTTAVVATNNRRCETLSGFVTAPLPFKHQVRFLTNPFETPSPARTDSV